ncbi:MAG TPA: TonB-dependent receptor [Terriglobia bacterium]|nr:TonB-dependent receptor [Terriglobia bacterium]
MPHLKRLLTFVGLWLVVGSISPAWGQSDRGTMTGTVTDSSGAVMAGVSLTATNTLTGISTSTVSSSAGDYTIPLLRAGTYDVTAEQSGFKKYVQAGVTLAVGQTLSLDIRMQVGAATQTVEVKAQAVQLEKDTSDRGTFVSGREVLELPIVGQGEQRNPGYFMTLAPGVTGRGVSYSGSPRMLNTTVNGSQSASNEFQLDGALIGSAAEWAGDFRNLPFPQDAVGEFKVMTLNPPAEYGRTGQGITSFTLRSGTNQLHGSAYEFLRNDALDSRGFFRATVPVNKQNEFGVTVGGPLDIPKIYKGRDKTFFFGWYQGFRLAKQTGSALDTLPTAAMRGGDLSNILGPAFANDALGRPIYADEIYDPATERTVPAGGVDPVTGLVNTSGSSAILRDAFGFDNKTGLPIAGQANVIPSNRIDPVAAKIFSYFPNPTLPGQRFGYTNNWLVSNQSRQGTNQWGSKIDHSINDKDRISGEFIWSLNTIPTSSGRWPGAIGDGSTSHTQQDIARFSQDYIFTPTFVNHWTLGFNRWYSDSVALSGVGWPAQLGWKGVPQTGPGSVFPGLNIGGLGNTYGNGGQGYDATNVFTVDESLTWTKGRHTVKGGFGYIKMQQNDGGYGRQSGYLSFNAGLTALPGSTYVDGCSPGGATPCTGIGAASFLLGLGSYGEADVYAAKNADRMGQYSGYIQDDFKVTPKLTANIGLRYDLLLPVVNAFNQFSWMDPTVTNTTYGIKGAMVFATPGRRTGATTFTKGFGPRIGLAYSINDKTVLRAGYGILYTAGGAQRSNRGCCSQGGFNSTNNLGEDTSTGFTGLLPSFTLSGGWPASQFPAPPFINQNYALGGAPHPIFPGDGRPPDIQNWTFGIQRQLPGQVLLDVAYVGTGGRHLVSRLNPTNQLNSKYLLDPTIVGASQATSPLFKSIGDPSIQALSVVQSMPVDPATGDHSPFPGFQALMGGNATLGQALRPFPQYTQEANFQMRDMMEGVGVSDYNALQVQGRKQFSQGLSFLVSYTWSKTLTNAESIFNEFSGFTQDSYNTKAEKALSINDYPNNLVFSYTYQFPFGPGQKFANVGGPAGKVVGGWSIAGIQQYESGRPNMIFSGTNPYSPYIGENGFLMRPNVVPGVPQRSPAFLNGTFDPNGVPVHINPSDTTPCTPANCIDHGALLNINAWTYPAWGTLGNAPRSNGGIRLPAYFNEDISLLKQTLVTERVRIEFRADFLNVFNRTVLGPDQGGDQYDSVLQGNALPWGFGGFGHLTSQGNYPREIQFGLKISY